MTISTATQNHDYFDLISRADLTYSDKIVLLYMLHPTYRDTSWAGHCARLKMAMKTFTMSVDRLVEKGYVEKIARADANRLRNYNCHRATIKAKRLCGAAA